MIDIQCLNKQQLAEFVASDTFRKLPHLPISRHRALAQCLNPRMDQQDVLLLLAWYKGEMVGYLGCLPDLFFPENEMAEKCSWLSCLWVDERHRGKSIAQKLVMRSVAETNGMVLLADYTPESRGVYDKLGFSDLEVRKGIRLYCRLELHRLLPPKRHFFQKIKPLLQAVDALGNVFVDLVARFNVVKAPAGTVEYVTQADAEVQQFISARQGQELCRRRVEDLNWAVQNPWVLSGPPNEESRRYYFSSVDWHCEFVGVKIRDAENRLCAFVILARRNHALKLPCCYFSTGAASMVASVIDRHIKAWRISTFTAFHPELVAHYQANRTAALFKKPINRYFLAARRFVERLHGRTFEMQDGDGDGFFT